LSVVKNDFLSVKSISNKNINENKNGKEKGPFGTLSEQLYQSVC
jgi:hypothetical protein